MIYQATQRSACCVLGICSSWVAARTSAAVPRMMMMMMICVVRAAHVCALSMPPTLPPPLARAHCCACACARIRTNAKCSVRAHAHIACVVEIDPPRYHYSANSQAVSTESILFLHSLLFLFPVSHFAPLPRSLACLLPLLTPSPCSLSFIPLASRKQGGSE